VPLPALLFLATLSRSATGAAGGAHKGARPLPVVWRRQRAGRGAGRAGERAGPGGGLNVSGGDTLFWVRPEDLLGGGRT